MKEEVWKIYKQNKNLVWEVSNYGRVRKNGIIVEPANYNCRYLSIGSFGIHRAVAELFIPNPENKPCVDHIDTNTHNNNVKNLRWVTQKENCNNPITRERYSKAAKNRPPVSEETRHKRSEAMKGENNPNFGKPKSEEWKQKRSESMKGENNPNFGKHPSKETRKKRSESMKGKNKDRHRVYNSDGTYHYEK